MKEESTSFDKNVLDGADERFILVRENRSEVQDEFLILYSANYGWGLLSEETGLPVGRQADRPVNG
jgi:hypothetical protein